MKCERYGGAPPLVDGGVCQLANFSTFRLFDLLGSRKVGDLETWRGGAEGARRGGGGEERARVFGLPAG